jgi:glutamine amidotransferase
VGAFEAVMEGLRRVGAPRLIERRLAGGRPVLGICVGLQVMFERGEEHGRSAEGLGQWPGAVTRLKAPVVPHMGWSPVKAPDGSVLFEGLGDQRFYFVHSYAAQAFPLAEAPPGPLARPLVTWADHGGPFVAAVENGPLSATQFHPEKSGDAGARLLKNWIGTL